MGKWNRFLKDYWITIWLILAVTAVFAFSVSGEYIQNQNREKRVVANMGDTGKRFSSERLFAVNRATANEVPFPSNGTAPCEIDFGIYNYSMEDIAKWYPHEIYYQISAKLVDSEGDTIASDLFSNNVFGIKCHGDPDYRYFTSYDEEKTIKSSENMYFDGTESISSHQYQICFPRTMTIAEDEKRIYIELEVTPYSDENCTDRITELDVLKNRLSVIAQTKAISSGWSGYFQDSTYGDLDGFNFVFTGNGEAKLVFCYDSRYLEMSQWFTEGTTENNCYYDYRTVTDQDTGKQSQVWTKFTGKTGWNTVVINADSDIVNRYDIQLYMKSPDASPSNYFTTNEEGKIVVDWNMVNGYVKFNTNAPANAETISG